MRLILLGAPGSGKGTQAEQIASRLAIAHLSTGEMLRAAATSKSAFGRDVQAVMERGDLVSDDIVVKIVAERLQKDDVKSGYVLDGFPGPSRRQPPWTRFSRIGAKNWTP
jgi:adenylate kinase